jgi:hypothetical protein
MNSNQPANQHDPKSHLNHGQHNNRSIGWQFVVASSLIGLTAGLFAGMSESPVATALVGGIFGLIGGGGVLSLLVESRKTQGAADPEKQSGDAEHRLRPAATAISFLCMFCILGAFTGIGFREGWLVKQPQKKDTAELINIAEAAKDLERPVQLKLVILQSELHSLGVSPKQNNQLVSSYIAPNEEEDPEGLTENKPLADLKASFSEAKSAVRVALEAISELPEDDSDNDEENRNLKKQEKVEYADLKEAFDDLKKASRNLRKSNDILEALTAPELSIVLDIIAKYREAYGYANSSHQWGPADRPGTFSEADRKRRLSIKP